MEKLRAENNASRRACVVPPVAAPAGGLLRWKVTDNKTGATFFTKARTASDAVGGKDATAIRCDR